MKGSDNHMDGLKRIVKLATLALAAVMVLQAFPTAASAACPATNPVSALIAAIDAANADSKSNQHAINLFPQTTYVLSTDCVLPTITSKIHINGNGATIDGAGVVQVFNVAVNGDLRLNVLKVSGGSAFPGGGIYNAGALTVNDVIISGNNGGGIFNAGGTLILKDSTVSGNHGGAGGGGISNAGGTLILRNSTVNGNNGGGGGGGGIATDNGTLELINSSVSDNVAKEGGGISSFDSTVIIRNC